MTTFRCGFAFATAAVVALSACASGGSGGAAGGDEGNAPEDNTHTRSAQLFLTQAQATGDPARYQDAYEAAVQSILLEPMNPMGYFQAGQAQVGTGDYVAADTLFDKAMELYPPYAEDISIEREAAWINLFNAAIGPLNEDNFEEGIRLLEGAEAMYPEQRPEALINLGVSYASTDRPEDAIDAYSRALDVIRGPVTAEADSATAAGWRESEASVAFNLAQLLSQAGRYDEAIAEYEAYLVSNPGDVTALSSLAAVHAESGDSAAASAIYDELLADPNLGPRDRFNVGVGLYTAGVYDRAADAFAAVVEVAPESRDAVFNLAQSLFEGARWEELVPVGRRLLELDEHNSNTYTILAKALIETGAEQEAVEILQTGQALPYTLESGQLRPDPAGGGSLTGELTNNTLEAGSTVSLRVHFIAEDGADVGATDVRVTAPAQGMSEVFRADLSSAEPVMGYYFEVVSP